MPRRSNEITKVLRPVVKRARKAHTAADVRATDAELRAIREKLLPAAISYALNNGRRLPAFAVLCGCRVFVRTSIAGEVIVSPAPDAVPLAMSNPWRG